MKGPRFYAITNLNKLADHPKDEAALREALKCIAEHRQDSVLLTYLEDGTTYDVPFTIDVAYQRLGIEDRTLDDSIILSVYQLKVDPPSSQ